MFGSPVYGITDPLLSSELRVVVSGQVLETGPFSPQLRHASASPTVVPPTNSPPAGAFIHPFEVLSGLQLPQKSGGGGIPSMRIVT